MFDTMVITKAVAGLCATLLVFLLGSWLADSIYLPHGDAPQAYVIDTGASEEASTDEPAEAIDYNALYASADAAAGEGLWRNCRSCHSLEEGRNGTGPSLHGVVDREIDAMAGFNYTGALLQVGTHWTVENLARFLEAPRSVAPGTSMSYAGLRDPQDRVNLIAYLASQAN